MTPPLSRASAKESIRASAAKPTMAMQAQPATPVAPEEDQPGRQQKPRLERSRLQVDGQTKSSFSGFETARGAGAAIKKKFPILHVTICDGEEAQSTVIS